MTKQELRDLVDSTDARRLTRLLEKGNEFDDTVTTLKNQISDARENNIARWIGRVSTVWSI